MLAKLGKKKLIAIVIVPIVIGLLLFVSPLGQVIGLTKASSGSGELIPGAHLPMYRMKDRVVNLATTSDTRGSFKYVKVTIMFEYSGHGVEEFQKADPKEQHKKETELNAKLDRKNAQMNDIVTSLLSVKTADELNSAAGKDRLRVELQTKFNAVLAPEYQVIKVYLVDFLIQ